MSSRWIPVATEVDGVPAPLLGQFLNDGSMTEVEMRVALIQSVSRLTPHGLDEGLLLCDLASAELAAGHRSRAADLLDDPAALAALESMADRVLGPARIGGEQVEELRVGARFSPGLDDLARLAALAGELAGGAGFAELAAELRIDLRLRRSGTIRALVNPLSRWIEAPGVGTMMGGKLLRHRVDLRAVPPRLLQWGGASHDEIVVAANSDGSRVSIRLQRPPRPGETLRLYASDGHGRLLEDVPLVLEKSMMVGQLSRLDIPVATAWLGVYSNRADPRQLAIRAIGPAVDAERLLVQSWTASRFGLAAAAALAAEQGAHRGHSSGHDPARLAPRWLQATPTARASAVAARGAALQAGAEDHRIIAATFTAYADLRAWNLRTTTTGPERPLLAELAHVLRDGSG